MQTISMFAPAVTSPTIHTSTKGDGWWIATPVKGGWVEVVHHGEWEDGLSALDHCICELEDLCDLQGKSFYKEGAACYINRRTPAWQKYYSGFDYYETFSALRALEANDSLPKNRRRAASLAQTLIAHFITLKDGDKDDFRSMVKAFIEEAMDDIG